MTCTAVRRAPIPVLLAAALAAPTALRAQSAPRSQPFLYTTLPTVAGAAAPLATLDLGYAERSFDAVAPEHFEMRLGVQSALSRHVSLLARAGFVPGGADAGAMVDAEILLTPLARHPGTLAFGVGAIRDYDGTGEAVARVAAAHRGTDWQLGANVTAEHPFSPDRDAVDVLTSVGYDHRLASGVVLGVEAVGEDLEGLIEADEAEGGAKLMLGPTLTLAPAASRWAVVAGAGPILYIRRNDRFSPAPRELGSSGYALRFSLRHR